MKASEILSKAADRIEPDGAWGQHGFYAVTADGWPLPPEDPEAKCFCAVGAIRAVNGGGFHHECEAFVSSIIGDVVERWNDKPGRTQFEVVSALRQAAVVAREKEFSL